jgi:catechol 2,3-dioxygenase-like lactoylglutathione lyase family enzyme
VLLNGFNHVAVLTQDSERFVSFYQEVFEAEVFAEQSMGPMGRLTLVRIGEQAEINLFELSGNHEADHQTPMFGRGRLDHLGLQAASLEAFEEIRHRLIERAACDEFVTDWGPMYSLFFTDPDGLEGEVCVANPDAVAGVLNPPGTPASRYVRSM